MPGTKAIIQEAESLPIEERAIVIDALLRSLNTPKSEIDQKWIDVAKQRLAELRSGKIQAKPGEQVFAQIRERFGR